MARPVRQRISYVLPAVNSAQAGHRLGVNGLAVDEEQAILYSGGRDGSICAWDLHLDLLDPSPTYSTLSSDDELGPGAPQARATSRAQTQAHTHWINDIALAQGTQALVSASSDSTVKVWRPWANADVPCQPQTIGQHADYVKCLASPGSHADWIASGGLDRRILIWDLHGAGKMLEIGVGDEEHVGDKGSVYALGMARNVLASGGPESVVRLWDSRTGRRITKFVGHTDNIRDIMINATGDMVMTASSDQTIKVWSITAGRCLHTLTMHNDSVWSLSSPDPQLGVFYSSDRSGLVVKTDIRGTIDEMDNGLSVALVQENEGVNDVVAVGGYVWTATSNSSINRWADVDTGFDALLPGAYRKHRLLSAESLQPSLSYATGARAQITPHSILRMSNTATFPLPHERDPDTLVNMGGRKNSEAAYETDLNIILPVQDLPQEAIGGQAGFIKHKMLNDKRRVLTLDTAGNVVLWDIIKCMQLETFESLSITDAETELNTIESIPAWCSLDTRTGSLTVTLELASCFDAEVYADELDFPEPIDFREDQRINLGKWVLRHLFSQIVDELIKRDEFIRSQLNAGVRMLNIGANDTQGKHRRLPSLSGIPQSWLDDGSSDTQTPRANGSSLPPMTPGLKIGIVMPGLDTKQTLSASENGQVSNQQTSQNGFASNENSADYFSSQLSSSPKVSDATKPAISNDDNTTSETPLRSPIDDNTANGGIFGKKFRMGMPFASKKRTTSTSATTEKPLPPDGTDTSRGDDGTSTNAPEQSTEPQMTRNNISSILYRMRMEYGALIQAHPHREIDSLITPSLAHETPTLKLPPRTVVMIQEESGGGVIDLFRGSVASLKRDVKTVEEQAPEWLGNLLLCNKIPYKDPVKIAFTLSPYQDSLPTIVGPDGNTRLNANRMLRVKKILVYIAERLDIVPGPYEQRKDINGETDDGDDAALEAETWLELWCNGQKLSSSTTLATLRAHIWRSGTDIALIYRSNGRRQVRWGGTRAGASNAGHHVGGGSHGGVPTSAGR